MPKNFLSDGFETTEVTRGVNAAPVSLGPVAKSALFEPKHATTTEIGIELVNETLRLVQSSPRGGVAMPHTPASRSLIKFRAAHLRTSSTILAQSWENRTGFGQQGAPAQVLQERDRILAEHARRIAATIDFHQTRALQGQILDADGSVMVDLLAEFGVTLLTVDCALDVSTTNASNKIVEAKRKSEAELGMAAAESWLCFASAEYMDAIRAHQSFEPSVAGWSAATVLSADHRDGTLNIAGVKFLEVPNRAGQTYIAPGDAYLVPAGVPDLCITTFCPADYIDTVNMEGQPLYSRAQEMDFNRGITLETQANPISYCTRPKVVIRLAA